MEPLLKDPVTKWIHQCNGVLTPSVDDAVVSTTDVVPRWGFLIHAATADGFRTHPAVVGAYRRGGPIPGLDEHHGKPMYTKLQYQSDKGRHVWIDADAAARFDTSRHFYLDVCVWERSYGAWVIVSSAGTRGLLGGWVQKTHGRIIAFNPLDTDEPPARGCQDRWPGAP